MDGENKVAGVRPGGANPEPTLANNVVNDLNGILAERQRVAEAEAAAAAAAVPKPSAEVAAAAEQLATEVVEPPRAPVFDEKSNNAKSEHSQKIKKQVLWVLVGVISVSVIVAVIILILQLVQNNNLSAAKEQSTKLHSAIVDVVETDEENNCNFVIEQYSNEQIDAETYDSYAENCRKDLQKLTAAIEDANGTLKNTDKWVALKENYDKFMPNFMNKIDSYKTGHEFLIAYNKLDWLDGGAKSLETLKELIKKLEGSSDEVFSAFAEEIVNKATNYHESYKKMINLEQDFIKKYGDNVAAAQKDAKWSEFEHAKEAFEAARGAYDDLAETIYKDEAMGNLAELRETLVNQANSLKNTINNR